MKQFQVVRHETADLLRTTESELESFTIARESWVNDVRLRDCITPDLAVMALSRRSSPLG